MVSPPAPIPAAEAGAVLRIDLAALVSNWRTLAAISAPAECAAVVKADAYGLGVDPVAPVLLAAGCRTFFVAHLSEAIRLRTLLRPAIPRILVLNGLPPGTAPAFAAHGLLPVLNSLRQLAEWSALGRTSPAPLPCALQLDTGMSRFGLPPEDSLALSREPGRLLGTAPELLMSHLGCADEPAHPANDAQLREFDRLRASLPPIPASLAASYGLALGPAYRYDLTRPGAALYGVPVPGLPVPHRLRPVVRLQGRIAQLRSIPPGSSVGYGARFTATRPTRIATVAVGYADGLLRALGDGHTFAALPEPEGAAAAAGTPLLPVVGRISMDSLAVDVTDLPPPPACSPLAEGDLLDLLGGPRLPLDRVAAGAGTIGYELLTALGSRYHRHYSPAPDVVPACAPELEA